MDRNRNGGYHGLEAGGMRSCLMDTEFQVGKMKNLLEIDGGDSYTVMCI